MNSKQTHTSLNESLSKELISTSMDLSVDYAEIAISDMFSNEALKEIPVIKTIIAISKTGYAIKEIHFTKKIMTFLSAFHTGKVEDEKLNEFRKRIKEDDKYRSKVTNQITIALDRIISEFKAKILARALLSHIDGKYDWDTYTDIAICIDSMFMIDFKIMKFLNTRCKPIKVEDITLSTADSNQISASIERLKTYGFIERKELTLDEIGASFNERIILSNFGSDFFSLCCENEN